MLSGCGVGSSGDAGSPGGSASSVAERPDIDASVVRGQALWDYEPSPTLTADIDRWDVAVSGQVHRWSSGRSVHDDGTVAHWAVLAVDVENAAKVVEESQRETVYFSVLLGHELLEPGKESAAETRTSRLAEFEEAVPAGTRIIGIGPVENNSPAQYPATVRVEQPADDPTGGAPLVALSSQGGILETSTGGFDTMRAEVEDLTSWAAHAAQLAGNDARAHDSSSSFANLAAELAQYEPL